MKDLKTEIDSLQKELKKLKNNPQKALKVQNEMMEINMKYMMHSMRSTFITFIPIIIIFGWLSSNIAYLPIEVNEPFNIAIEFSGTDTSSAKLILPPAMQSLSDLEQDVTKKKATWNVIASEEGLHTVMIEFDDYVVEKDILISEKEGYIKPIMRKKGFTDFIYESYPQYIPKEVPVNYVTVGNEQFKANIFGLHIGWLGTYILFSIIFSIALRKVLKIY
jgi:uncharacterized membrane protein (DUF106 family)